MRREDFQEREKKKRYVPVYPATSININCFNLKQEDELDQSKFRGQRRYVPGPNQAQQQRERQTRAQFRPNYERPDKNQIRKNFDEVQKKSYVPKNNLINEIEKTLHDIEMKTKKNEHKVEDKNQRKYYGTLQNEPQKKMQEKERSNKDNRNVNYQNTYSRNTSSSQHHNHDQKRNNCEKYLKGSKPINFKELGIDFEIRKLKKLFMDAYKNVKEATIMHSDIYPTIFFEYVQEGDTFRYYKLLREFIKDQPKVKDNVSCLETIFQRLFRKVDPKFYNLSVFAIEKGKQVRVHLKKEALFDKYSDSSQLMFYYMKGEKKNKTINFVIFDKFLRNVEFSTHDIKKFQDDHPDEFKAYDEFSDIALNDKIIEEVGNDILGNQQLESDEEKESFIEESAVVLERKLKKLINKDLRDLQEKIEKKNQDFMQLSQLNQSDPRFQKLGDQIEELEINKENFQKIRNQITEIMNNSEREKKLSKQFLKNSIKKMIIAEKQLQSRLPIVTKKKQIFELLRKNQLLIIEGETGSGKSTQLPQMLCEFYDLFDNPESKPVLVTQPRRLATRSLAERVAYEMEQKIGGFVDYVSSADRKANPKAKIIFKLDRLVLDELTEDQILSKYSCLVIDEAHERTISIDVILGLVKNLISKRKDFKVIVTSASMDITLFENYFNTKTLKVSGRLHPVNIIYRPYETDDMVRKIQKVLWEEVFFNKDSLKEEFKGHVLVFCSGIDIINRLFNIFTTKLNQNVFKVFALHGKIDPADQKLVFLKTKQHKIIFASRIAETAITIDGVKVVIDPGEDIQMIYDQRYKISSMKVLQISQSSAKQRAGRAGRTAPGTCIRLYNQRQFMARRPNKIPEIQNTALDTVVLRIKSLKIKDVIKFPYISRPNVQGLKNSIEILKMIGGLDENQNITKIGQLLIKIPIEPFLSRAIIEAMFFQNILQNDRFILEEVLEEKKISKKDLERLREEQVPKCIIQILCMVINCSNLFYIPQEKRQLGEQIKYKEFSDEDGDFFFLKNIYHEFKIKNQTKNKNMLNYWLKDHFLSRKSLNSVAEMQKQISKIIKDFSCNLNSLKKEMSQAKVKFLNCKSSKDIILACLATSFCTNICRYSGNPNVGYTFVSQKKPIQIYGTSNLSLLGICPEWIVCYDLFNNKDGKLFCKVAQKIDFKFMEKIISNYVWKQYKLIDAEKINPFYKEIPHSLPTKIFQQVKFDYQKKESKQELYFLNEISLAFVEEINQVSFYIAINQSDNEKIKTEKEKRIQLYLQNLRKDTLAPFKHNYIGSTNVFLQNGFKIQRIQFTNSQYLVQIFGVSEMVLKTIMEACSLYGRIQYSESKRMKIFIEEDTNKQMFEDFLTHFKLAYPDQTQGITRRDQLIDKRRKLPQTKILIHFFAGESEKGNMFMGYDSIGDYNPAETMCQYLEEGLIKKARKGQDCKINGRNLHLSKKKNGINYFSKDQDQYQIAEAIYELEKQGILHLAFKMPKYIKKFRQPNISEALKNNETWKDEINKKILDKLGIQRENVIINIRGHYKPEANKLDKNKKTSQLEKQMRVEMYAELRTLKFAIFDKIKRNFDGKIGILGCEKMHVRSSFDQVVAFPSYRVYDSLYEEYQFKVQVFKAEHPLMTFDTIVRRVRNKEKVLIICRSPNREDFINPMRELSNLFTPKLLKLEEAQFKFLEKVEKGNEIIEKIQSDFRYQIYFGFQKFTHTLKVYCENSLLGKIEAQLKEKLKDYKFFTDKISYRGKNLNKVLQILNNNKLEVSRKDQTLFFLDYEIIFKFREVKVTADLQTFECVKNKIQKLIKADKKECNICADIMHNPYKLLTCDHTFCWICLASHIRNFRNSPGEQILKCPEDDCNKQISIYDVKTMLSEEEFQKICDIKISSYVSKHTNIFTPCTKCEQIFDKKESEKIGYIDCESCGTYICIKCNQPHKNYTCEEWKFKDQLNLKKLGIKQCPTCKMGIEKNKGCNHIQCIKCKSHICWKCLKVFKTSPDCYDHLSKVCGGIFDVGYRD